VEIAREVEGVSAQLKEVAGCHRLMPSDCAQILANNLDGVLVPCGFFAPRARASSARRLYHWLVNGQASISSGDGTA